MPGKHTFTKAERWAIWSAHDGHCFWCAEPFDYKFCTIDHVIPESLQNDPAELARTLEMYGLPPEFAINDFCNWVPAHQRCNGTKASLVFEATPAFLLVLKRLQRKERQARAFFEKFNTDRAVNSILAALEAALHSKQVPLERVQELVRTTLASWETDGGPLESVQAAAAQEDPILVVGGWAVRQRTGDIAYVTRGKQVGYTYVGREDTSGFTCGHCGRLGPWNGSRCMTCGIMSHPDD